jgi:hypothetical protein
MKVRITSAALGTYWYADKIGEVFEVKEHPDQRAWKVVNLTDYTIQKDDCVLLSEHKLDKLDEKKEALLDKLSAMSEPDVVEGDPIIENSGGLTRSQIQRVIDEGYLVKAFDDDDIAEWKDRRYCQLIDFNAELCNFPFIVKGDTGWSHTELVRKPGIRQPNFGEKPDLPEGTRVMFKTRDGKTGYGEATNLIWELDNSYGDLMEFIYYD